FFFQAEDGIRDRNVTGVQTCALPICCFMTTTSTDTIRESTAVVEASHIAVETTQQMIERLEKSPLLLEAKDLDVTYVVEEGEVRSEERRVGKEHRARGCPGGCKEAVT